MAWAIKLNGMEMGHFLNPYCTITVAPGVNG
jgi:hypothetical protein